MDSKRYIDLGKAVELVLSNIEERGADYIYTQSQFVQELSELLPGRGCYNLFFDIDSYVSSDGDFAKVTGLSKGCLVGSVFADLGISLEEIQESNAIDGSSTTTAGRLGITLSPVAQEYLSFVQGRQDDGIPWGQAHSEALYMVLGSTWISGQLTPDELKWLDVRDGSVASDGS